MSPGINVRALPSATRTVALLPRHWDAGPSNGFVHHESRRTFWIARASWSHPRAERRQLVGAILKLTIALLVSSFEYSSFVAHSISARQEDERACKRRLELSTSTLTRCVG